jgi:NADH dehydrogenase
MYGPIGDVDLEKLSNLFDEEQIRKFIKASCCVINLVGILTESKQSSFEAIHTRFPAMLSRLCAEYDKSLIHISSLGIETSSATSRYAKTKLEGEKIILETLKNKSIILRSGLMVGTDDKFFNTLASLCQISPFLPLIGQGLNNIQPIAVTDTAKAIAEVLEKEEINNNIYELGGPNTFAFKELMEILLKQIKKRRFLLPIPIPFAKVLGRILQVMPKPLLTADQVELMQYDSVVGNKYSTLKDLKINPKTINEVLPSYIWRHRQEGQFSKL